MTGTPNKRQKRNDYRANLQASTNGTPLEAPKKKFYRQRAHANPFSDHSLTYPTSPSAMDWSVHFPAFVKKPLDPSTITTPLPSSPSPPKLSHPVEIADIGCGFGGLLVALSPLFPRTPMIGMELRTQVTDYVIDRVQALRSQNQSVSSSAAAEVASPAAAGSEITPGPYQNVSALRANTMKFLPNFFGRGQLAKVFLCFPDPHFKARKHKARIVSAQLNAEYAFVLRPGGRGVYDYGCGGVAWVDCEAF